MTDEWANLAGEVARWPTKSAMASLLASAGLTVQVGRYSIRVLDCTQFVFQEFGGDTGEPTIDAGAPTVAVLMQDATLVSGALRLGNIKHRFEIYDGRGKMQSYLHHDWPREDSA